MEKKHLVEKQSHKSECSKQTDGSWISWRVRIVEFSKFVYLINMRKWNHGLWFEYYLACVELTAKKIISIVNCYFYNLTR